jgi:hypothetical protein
VIVTQPEIGESLVDPIVGDIHRREVVVKVDDGSAHRDLVKQPASRGPGQKKVIVQKLGIHLWPQIVIALKPPSTRARFR